MADKTELERHVLQQRKVLDRSIGAYWASGEGWPSAEWSAVQAALKAVTKARRDGTYSEVEILFAWMRAHVNASDAGVRCGCGMFEGCPAADVLPGMPEGSVPAECIYAAVAAAHAPAVRRRMLNADVVAAAVTCPERGATTFATINDQTSERYVNTFLSSEVRPFSYAEEMDAALSLRRYVRHVGLDDEWVSEGRVRFADRVSSDLVHTHARTGMKLVEVLVTGTDERALEQARRVLGPAAGMYGDRFLGVRAVALPGCTTHLVAPDGTVGVSLPSSPAPIPVPAPDDIPVESWLLSVLGPPPVG